MPQSVTASLRTILSVGADMLQIARVSYWELAADGSALRCRMLFDRETGAFHEGGELRAADYPRYFEAMREHRAIVAHDAWTDLRTNEFLEAYLQEYDIRSMLDVPVWRDGKLAGVMCHEQVGSARTWTAEEQEFVLDMSNLVDVGDGFDLRARLAHEINNPLTYIHANLTAALEELSSGACDRQELIELLREAHEGAERLRRIVRELRLVPTVAQPAKCAEPEPEASPRRRVLLVDDEAPIRKVLCRILEPAHDVMVAECGVTALEQLRAGIHFDVVLCDLMMPRMTGMELYDQLVADGSPLAQRIIFMTGSAFSQRSREFIAACDRPVIEKPIDKAVLRRAIAAIDA